MGNNMKNFEFYLERAIAEREIISEKDIRSQKETEIILKLSAFTTNPKIVSSIEKCFNDWKVSLGKHPTWKLPETWEIAKNMLITYFKELYKNKNTINASNSKTWEPIFYEYLIKDNEVIATINNNAVSYKHEPTSRLVDPNKIIKNKA